MIAAAYRVANPWKITAYRHTGVEPVSGTLVPAFDPEFLHKVIPGDRVDHRITFNSMAEPLLYYIDDEVDDV